MFICLNVYVYFQILPFVRVSYQVKDDDTQVSLIPPTNLTVTSILRLQTYIPSHMYVNTAEHNKKYIIFDTNKTKNESWYNASFYSMCKNVTQKTHFNCEGGWR